MKAGFDFNKYLVRAGKYLVYLTIVFVLIVAIFSLTSGQGFNYEVLFRPGSGVQIIIFLVLMSLVYPFFGYATRKVYLNRDFESDKEGILGVFTTNRYVIESQGEGYIRFKHTAAFVRVVRMGEDTITLFTSENPIKIEGARKDVLRLARMIEYHQQKFKE